MSIKKCPTCRTIFDSNWEKQDDGTYKCPYCGLSHDMDAQDLDPTDPRKKKSDEYSKIYRELENLHFASACEELRELRQKYKEDARVYFLSALANNCVCYTQNDDDKSKWPFDKIPTLNNIKFENIVQSDYAKKAIELAKTSYEKDMYQKTFEYMETVREKIEAAYKKGEYKYDVFISTKVSKVDSNGKVVVDEFGDPEKTTDYKLAEGLYELIRKQLPSCKVFLSEKLSDLFLGKEYENIIFSALHSAKVFILVGNSIENIEWHWVRNEWMRYLYLMDPNTSEDAEKRKFVFVTRGMNPGDIPAEFKKRQHIFWGQNVGAETDLINFIREGVVGKQAKKKLESKSFETSVGEIEHGELEEMSVAKINFDDKYQDVDAELTEQIDAAIHSLIRASQNPDPVISAKRRKAAFMELESIADSSKDAYKARLYLLLRDTNYTDFDSYFKSLKSISSDGEFADRFFEYASQEDAERSIKTVVDSLVSKISISGDSIVAKGDSSDKIAISNINSALSRIILKYIDYVPSNDLKKVLAKLEDIHKFGFKKSPYSDTELADNILYIKRFIDGNDATKYIDARLKLIDSFDGLSFDFDSGKKETKSINKWINEILAVDKSNVKAMWVLACCKMYGKYYAKPCDLADKLIKDLM